MRKTKKATALGLALTMAMGLVACGGSQTAPTTAAPAGAGQTAAASTEAGKAEPAASAGEYVIGNPQPLTGVNALVGDASNKAAALAVKYINENGGMNGSTVRLINYDDQGSPEEAVKLANKMNEIDKVDAILGSLTSSCMLAAGGYYNDAKIVTLGNGNSPTWMTKDWEYVFRSCLNTALSMPYLCDKMVDMDIKTVSIFQGQDDAAKSSAETFVKECEARGIKVLTIETYTDGDTDYSGQCAKIINSKPDVVFCSTNGPTQAIFAKQIRQLGFNGLCFNREAFTADSLQVAGTASDNWVFVYPYITYNSVEEATDPDMQKFLQIYQDEYGEMPFHDCAYRAWDSMMVLYEASKIAGSNDSDALCQAINSIKDFKVLGGILDFTDGSREGLHSLNTYLVKDGKYTDFDQWVVDGGYEELKASME